MSLEYAESDVEEAALRTISDLQYEVLSGLDIAPGRSSAGEQRPPRVVPSRKGPWLIRLHPARALHYRCERAMAMA